MNISEIALILSINVYRIISKDNLNLSINNVMEYYTNHNKGL